MEKPHYVETIDVLLGDPLRQLTRSARRSLLAASAVSLTITQVGIIPTKISTLGIEITTSEIDRLILILNIVVGYFLFAFLFAGWADILRFKRAINEVNRARSNNVSYYPDENEFDVARIYLIGNRPPAIYLLLRLSFEFLFPIVAAIAAIGFALPQ